MPEAEYNIEGKLLQAIDKRRGTASSFMDQIWDHPVNMSAWLIKDLAESELDATEKMVIEGTPNTLIPELQMEFVELVDEALTRVDHLLERIRGVLAPVPSSKTGN